MTRFVDFTTNFSTGELDPLLRARVDLQQYGNALAKATNVLIQPQGGLRRRPGLKHILELPNSSTASAGNGVRLVPFSFSVDDSYMLCFTHNRMYVIKNGVVQANINGSGNSYLTTTIGSSIVDDMCWTQSADTLIVVHPDLQPVRITRTSDTAWTATTITFDSIPKYAFNIDFHTNNGSTLTPSAVSGNITLTASTTHHDSGAAQAGTSTTITLKSTASATDDIYNGMYVTITSGTGAGQIRIIEDYVGSTKVATVTPAWTTTPTSASNKVLLLASINVDNTAKTQQGISAILTGGNTASYRGVANGTMQRAAIGQGVFDNSRVVSNMNFNYLDSPATTSAITYGVSINYVANGGGTQVLYVNRGSTYDDVNYGATYASTITAIEVTP